MDARLIRRVKRVVRDYGGLPDAELARIVNRILGLENDVLRAMAFGMMLDDYVRLRRRIRNRRDSIDEVELYPELFSG